MPGKTRCLLVLSLAVLVSALGAQSAAATVFCVPTLAACPGGTGVAKTDLEEAMGANGKDGQADVVYVGAGTFTENDSFEPNPGSTNVATFEPAGSDPLTVIGAGANATTMTSAGNSNIYVVNLSYNNSRDITLQNLSIEIPSSFPDSLGAGILLFEGDKLESAAVVSFNDESNAVRASGDGNEVRGVVIRGGGLEGSVSDGIVAEFGSTLAERVELEGVSWGLLTNTADSELTAREVHEVGTRTYGAIATIGAITLENSVFELDDGVAIYASAGSAGTLVKADHLTVQNSGASGNAGIEVSKASGSGDVTVEVSNSILRGFGSGYREQAVSGPGIGVATLKYRYSNFQHSGTHNAVFDESVGNIDADPLFLANLSLPANSPSVDAGDPAPGGLAFDFLKAPRPNDGDGDGAAVRDQGAFEYQRPAPPKEEGGGGGGTEGGGGSAGGGGSGGTGGSTGSGSGSGTDLTRKDTAPPQTTIAKGPGGKLAQGKAKFSFRASEAGSTFVCKLDHQKAKPCASPKRYSALKPGPHAFKVWAVDAAGNKDATPAKRSFKVPA